MPIIYNEKDDSWNVEEPSEAEKVSLFQIAADHLTHFFGHDLAERMIKQSGLAEVDETPGTLN